jgi:hypothetical protein
VRRWQPTLVLTAAIAGAERQLLGTSLQPLRAIIDWLEPRYRLAAAQAVDGKADIRCRRRHDS